MSARLYEVEVKATVYVLAESEREAERIACSCADGDFWLRGFAFPGPVEPAQIDRDWRDVPPLRDYGDEDTGETLAREVAARQARLPGVAP